MNVIPNLNQSVDDVEHITLAARDALTDQMIERFAATGSNALELLDRLNDETTNAAIHGLIDRLTEMHKTGALDTVCDMVMLVHAMRSALTDGMIERLFGFAEHMVTTVANEEVCTLVDNACHAMKEAAAESALAPDRGGLMASIALLSQPHTHRSLQFLMSFAHKLTVQTNNG